MANDKPAMYYIREGVRQQAEERAKELEKQREQTKQQEKEVGQGENGDELPIEEQVQLLSKAVLDLTEKMNGKGE
ncbi:hypothetical protein [Mangrovibacillus cuniculi]|uniref:Uncharacterized protein n=1 Tax=Mangrovibacillus cuniculi TaxID=2593652 RepID=A0A7S8HG38_9BACI|nr:hypothetical protein [Mangrovibacillus cuniculi]QPC47362.1 hypothetical protein G8O30_10585 [Mangrovibacillus cuniculi]